ncbi:uracil-DNA glycosylase family protein, partial [Lutimonas sp.]|uniref:uracil-DNA glycosylase family protein n=1 Tax=Lutimonas sp. TaxID=1872403 RepID=UPI003D9B2D6B
MFLHQHPYPPFIPENATTLIVGTIPPPRFSTGELLSEDVDFCYGSKYGLLWPILSQIFDLDLLYEPTNEAIQQRKNFLIKQKIGICDIIESCRRLKIDASDVGMDHIDLRNLLACLENNTGITTILFMGGNSKNGPEYLFRKFIKSLNIDFIATNSNRPRRH